MNTATRQIGKNPALAAPYGNGPSFVVPAGDANVIFEIVNRAMKLYARFEMPADRFDVQMDITACHANGCPLRLVDLLAADDFNFVHDVVGIRRHLNRNTGKLEDHFNPRFRERGTE